MKKRILILLIIFGYLVMIKTNPVSAQWFNTVSGDVHVEGNLNPRVPAGQFFSAADAGRGASGIVTFTSRSNTGNGSQTFNPLGMIDLGSAPPPPTAMDRLVSRYSYNYFFDKFPTKIPFGPPRLQGSNISVCDSATPHVCIKNTAFQVGNTGASNFVTIPDGETYVFFVNGNLTITRDILNADTDSLIVFIVRGNIIINADSTAPTTIQGIFIADGNIISNGNDRLNVDGIVMAQGLVDLNRISGDAITPAEQFRYTPSFMLSVPDDIKKRRVSSWEILNP
ncbi:MAG: hypothetical protein NUV98_03915 [Candidatus Roizmanbacteria bacterium]|nr:hypothetical protein [Candidatus Roizmanbacteria bacterium]